VGESEEDDAGEIGELGEEIVRNDMNDLPIERPKCLSNINLNQIESNPNNINNPLNISSMSL
jgi:hypothetical protein